MLLLRRDPEAATSEVGVRAVGAFDLGRLSRLHKACFADGWSRSDLAHLLAMPRGFGLIARRQEPGFAGLDAIRGVGFALCRTTADECELLSLGVVPAQRRNGVARLLLEAAMQRCRNAGAKRMFLEVAIDNDKAKRLYEDRGFVVVGTRSNYYLRADGTRIHAHTMRLDLTCDMQRPAVAVEA